MLAEVSAAKHNSFYKSARKPGGRWQFLNNSQLHFLGKYLLMCPDNNVLWKCVCTMSLTKASLLTWTQLGTALEQCLTHKLLSSSNNKITSRIQLWTKQPSQITFTWGEKKKFLKEDLPLTYKTSNMNACSGICDTAPVISECFPHGFCQVAQEWSFKSLCKVSDFCPTSKMEICLYSALLGAQQ